MKLIALSGGIASGKSTIAKRFAELGAVTIDADVLAREAVEPGSAALAQIIDRFGRGVIRSDGTLDRANLAALVFQDPEALAALNSIVHPAVRELAQLRISEIEAARPEAIVVYEIPLLVEAGVQLPWHRIIVADAPDEVRLRRLVELRGMDHAEADRRIRSQASSAERRAIADAIIDTGGTEADTLRQVDELWRTMSADE